MNKAASFNQLDLEPNILEAIKACGYESPTPIQTLAVPHVLEGKDVFGAARTGTGKTAAFVWPILSKLARSQRLKVPRALILEPTRELAIQTWQAIERYRGKLALKAELLVGGMNIEQQASALFDGCDLIVATPGRLYEHVLAGTLSLDDITSVVLDEADKLLELGFYTETRRLLRACKPGHQILFFSATLIPEVEEWAEQLLNDPIRVEADPTSSLVSTMHEKAFRTLPRNKAFVLAELLATLSEDARVMVFVRTRANCDGLADYLKQLGYNARSMHGQMKQKARLATVEAFQAGDFRVLVTSDVAARGLDINDVQVVINMDLPANPLDYVHRVGRSARMGRKGEAWSLISDHEVPYLKSIQETTGREIPLAETPTLKALDQYPSFEPVLESSNDKQEQRPRRKEAAPNKARRPGKERARQESKNAKRRSPVTGHGKLKVKRSKPGRKKT